MTENEAIEDISDFATGASQDVSNMSLGIAIKALEEIQQYRAIGTVEKCRAAMEKQIPKKVEYEDVGYDRYNNVNVYACICPSCGLEIIKFNDNDISDKCESYDIEKLFHSSMVHHAYIGLNNYCNRCGQKLDWSDKK